MSKSIPVRPTGALRLEEAHGPGGATSARWRPERAHELLTAGFDHSLRLWDVLFPVLRNCLLLLNAHCAGVGRVRERSTRPAFQTHADPKNHKRDPAARAVSVPKKNDQRGKSTNYEEKRPADPGTRAVRARLRGAPPPLRAKPAFFLFFGALFSIFLFSFLHFHFFFLSFFFFSFFFLSFLSFYVSSLSLLGRTSLPDAAIRPLRNSQFPTDR